MNTETNGITVGNMATILSEVILVMLGGIRLAFPVARQYDIDNLGWLDSGMQNADEAINYFVQVATHEFRNEGEPNNYEFALDAIKEETTKLVKWYSNLKPNYQSR